MRNDENISSLQSHRPLLANRSPALALPDDVIRDDVLRAG
jgi:hypothetical protein